MKHTLSILLLDSLEPAISGIPRYLIFDSEGNLSSDHAGYGPAPSVSSAKKSARLCQ